MEFNALARTASSLYKAVPMSERSCWHTLSAPRKFEVLGWLLRDLSCGSEVRCGYANPYTFASDAPSRRHNAGSSASRAAPNAPGALRKDLLLPR